jgi:hypothetical protein
MKISPPIATLAILAVGVAGTTWLSPPPNEPAQVTVTLPYATYSSLAQRGSDRAGAGGQALTVAQMIGVLAQGEIQ